jgi:hypothetical protein
MDESKEWHTVKYRFQISDTLKNVSEDGGN